MHYQIERDLKESGYSGDTDLASLIKACGRNFSKLVRTGADTTKWVAVKKMLSGQTAALEGYGFTPEEAVANLWLKLNPLR